jgi:tRNA(adenine34) deaminase
MGEPNDIVQMRSALALARRAGEGGEVPVGAVLLDADEILGEGFNQPVATHDPTAHAEIVALRAAAQRRGNYRLEGSTLYVTLEPCTMCVAALIHARVARVVFAAWDPKAGACGSLLDVPRSLRALHAIDVFGGVLHEEAGQLLKDFFAARR